MPGQTEIRPIKGGCRHLRGRYKIQQRARSPFPELELIRYECEQKHEIESDEDVEKCIESRLECWKRID